MKTFSFVVFLLGMAACQADHRCGAEQKHLNNCLMDCLQMLHIQLFFPQNKLWKPSFCVFHDQITGKFNLKQRGFSSSLHLAFFGRFRRRWTNLDSSLWHVVSVTLTVWSSISSFSLLLREFIILVQCVLPVLRLSKQRRDISLPVSCYTW